MVLRPIKPSSTYHVATSEPVACAEPWSSPCDALILFGNTHMPNAEPVVAPAEPVNLGTSEILPVFGKSPVIFQPASPASVAEAFFEPNKRT